LQGAVKGWSQRNLGSSFRAWVVFTARSVTIRAQGMKIVNKIGSDNARIFSRSIIKSWFQVMKDGRIDRSRMAMLSEFEQEKLNLQREAEEMTSQLKAEKDEAEDLLLNAQSAEELRARFLYAFDKGRHMTPNEKKDLGLIRNRRVQTGEQTGKERRVVLGTPPPSAKSARERTPRDRWRSPRHAGVSPGRGEPAALAGSIVDFMTKATAP